jgi:hypothetical protein
MKYYAVKKERNILRKANRISHILPRKCLIKHIIERKKGREEEEDNISSYWIFSRNREDTGNCKSKHWIALCRELVL